MSCLVILELENGITLLESQLININKSGINKVIIVTGYHTEKIESKVELYSEKYNIDIKIIYKQFFDISKCALGIVRFKTISISLSFKSWSTVTASIL